MRLKKHLYQCKRKGYDDVYVIRIKNKYVASRIDRDEIEEIYQKCVDLDWNIEKIMQMKFKYGWYNPIRGKMKYVYKTDAGGYYCKKNGKYYCSSTDLDTILIYRDFLIEHDWDKEKFKKHFGIEPRKKFDTPKYIYLTPNGTYQIRYHATCYGTFTKLEEALEERNLLMQFGWEYDFVDLV